MSRLNQQEIPGTEPKLPPGLHRQALKVLDLRDQLELAKQRLERATDYLHSAMEKASLPFFSVRDESKGRVTFRLVQPDPKVKLEDYSKPNLPDDGEAKD